jgi:subfamily B ATP-binding cassette protein HlyB/CyaB
VTSDDSPAVGQAPEQSRFDPALSAFVLLAKFLGTPAEPSQIIHDRGRGDAPFTYGDLVRIARKLGLVARTRSVDIAELGKLPAPTMLGTKDNGTIILLKVDENADSPRYLLQRPDGE